MRGSLYTIWKRPALDLIALVFWTVLGVPRGIFPSDPPGPQPSDAGQENRSIQPPKPNLPGQRTHPRGMRYNRSPSPKPASSAPPHLSQQSRTSPSPVAGAVRCVPISRSRRARPHLRQQARSAASPSPAAGTHLPHGSRHGAPPFDDRLWRGNSVFSDRRR